MIAFVRGFHDVGKLSKIERTVITQRLEEDGLDDFVMLSKPLRQLTTV